MKQIRFFLTGMMMLIAIVSTQAQLSAIKYMDQKMERVKQLIIDAKGIINPSQVNYTVPGKPNSIIEITRTPLYTQAQKTVGNPVEIPSSSCNALPVSYKATYNELSAYLIKNYDVYPGAAFKIGKLIDKSFEPYVGNSSRNPMNITTSILSGESPVTKVLKNFDIASYNQVWTPLLQPKLKHGTTGAEYIASICVVENMSQLQQDFNLTNEIGVDASLSVPVPDIPVTVDASNKLLITDETVRKLTSSSKKSYCVIKFEQIFYTAAATTTNNSPLFSGPLDADVVYVSSVDYGRVFVMTLESDVSREELANAVNYKLSNVASVGAHVVGLPAGFDIKNSYSKVEENHLKKLIENGSLNISCFQKGGKVIFTGPDFNAAIEKIKETTEFGPENVGSPISYTLKFADTHGPAWININNSYATMNCGKPYNNLFDIELELDHMEVSNCRDLDGTEDLYGTIMFTRLKANERSVSENITFWEKDKEDANRNNYHNGTHRIDKPKVLIKDITFEDLEHATLFIGGKLYDDEGAFASKKFKCMNANRYEGDFGHQKTEFADQDHRETRRSIENLVLNSEYQSLKFGNNSFIELTFCEDGIPDNGKVVFFFKVNVKPH